MLNGQSVTDRAGAARDGTLRRYSGWPLALLASTALVAVPAAMAPLGFPAAAFAKGGDGGKGDPGPTPSPGNPGAGGTFSISGPGGAGGNATGDNANGGGGGGAGTTGGAGGTSVKGGTGGTGGVHGSVVTTDPTAAATGSDGGNGYGFETNQNMANGGGGGGEGGYGIVTNGAGTYTISVNATGGKGGTGGQTGNTYGGDGGDGGVGLLVGSAGSTVTVNSNAIIKGGAGGQGGIRGLSNGAGYPGKPGKGGYGIAGTSLTLTLGTDATVIGGLNGTGTTRSDAIHFLGGAVADNTLILTGMPTLTGVIGFESGSGYTLRLAGSSGGTFDLSNMAATKTFATAGAFDIDTTGTWILTGTEGTTATYGTATLSGGTLQLGDASTAGQMNGGITIGHDSTLTNGAAGGLVQSFDFGSATGAQATGTLLVNQIAGGTALTVNNTLMLASTQPKAGHLTFNLGAPSATAVISAGTLDTDSSTKTSITITDAGSLDEGTYLLISASTMGQNISSSTLDLGSTPAGLTYSLSIGTHEVTLAVTDDGQYWNGTTTTGTGPIAGGTGTWKPRSSNDLVWSDATGAPHVLRDETQTVDFAGTAGTVTIDASSGAVKAKGLRFLTSGYEITGNTLTLDNVKGNTPKIKVVGAGSQATISSVIAGVQGMTKLGEGTLILTGTNTYTGNTTISEGTLQLGNGGTTGSILGNIQVDGTLVLNRSDDFTYSADTSGSGSVVKKGQNTVTVTSRGFVGPQELLISAGTVLLDYAKIGYSNSPLVYTRIAIKNGGILSLDPNRTSSQSEVTGNLSIKSGGIFRVYSGYTGVAFMDGGTTMTPTSIIETHLAAPDSTVMFDLHSSGAGEGQYC